MGMFKDYIMRYYFDIIFVGEITNPDIVNLRRYEAYLNIATTMRGTAIVPRSEIPLTNVTILPTGRAVAAESRGIKLIKLYAPSGTAKMNKRKRFYNTEHPLLLPAEYRKIILRVTSIVYLTPLTQLVFLKQPIPRRYC